MDDRQGLHRRSRQRRRVRRAPSGDSSVASHEGESQPAAANPCQGGEHGTGARPGGFPDRAPLEAGRSLSLCVCLGDLPHRLPAAVARAFGHVSALLTAILIRHDSHPLS
jgi:hypothetical protein